MVQSRPYLVPQLLGPKNLLATTMAFLVTADACKSAKRIQEDVGITLHFLEILIL